MKNSLTILGLLILIMPCTAQETIQIAKEKQSLPLTTHTRIEILPASDMPAVFISEIGSETHINRPTTSLFFSTDSSYIMITSRLSADNILESVVDIGLWTISSAQSRLVLHNGLNNPLQFTIENEDLLTQESSPRAAENEETLILRRTDQTELLTPPTMMSGMYSYMADAGIFKECRTGKPWPVAMEEDNIGLEGAYMEQNSEPAEDLFVTFTGRLELRFPMEGNTKRIFVIVDSFGEIHPDRSCDVRVRSGMK
jgi:uncharacterized lipoprotein NlpE involved in copper resistance